MRQFLRPVGLDRLSLEARLVYSAFSLFLLLGFASSLWLYDDDALGASSASAVRYVLGDEAGAPAQPSAASGGPSLTLPPAEALPSVRLQEAKPVRALVETFHFHIFTAALCLLVLAHLFMMCSPSTRFKVAVITVAFASTLLHLAAPLLTSKLGAGWAILVFPSALVMGLAWLTLTIWPLVEMWRLPPEEPGD